MKSINEKLYLALGILSGRKNPDNLSDDDLNTLGYDLYKSNYYGKPQKVDILERAERIIYNTLMRIFDLEEREGESE